jgi:hypothetical protein
MCYTVRMHELALGEAFHCKQTVSTPVLPIENSRHLADRVCYWQAGTSQNLSARTIVCNNGIGTTMHRCKTVEAQGFSPGSSHGIDRPVCLQNVAIPLLTMLTTSSLAA